MTSIAEPARSVAPPRTCRQCISRLHALQLEVPSGRMSQFVTWSPRILRPARLKPRHGVGVEVGRRVQSNRYSSPTELHDLGEVPVALWPEYVTAVVIGDDQLDALHSRGPDPEVHQIADHVCADRETAFGWGSRCGWERSDGFICTGQMAHSAQALGNRTLHKRFLLCRAQALGCSIPRLNSQPVAHVGPDVEGEGLHAAYCSAVAFAGDDVLVSASAHL